MGKIGLTLVLIVCLLFSYAVITAAEPGFHVGLGYEQSDNTLSVDVLGLGVDIHSPGKMYTVDLGCDFTDNFAINGKFGWGSYDLAKAKNVLIYPFDASITQDSQLWQVEAVGAIPVGENVKIGGIGGYLDSETKLKGTVTIPGHTYSGEAQQNYNGYYIGALVAVKPANNFEMGIAYRYLINPWGDLTIFNNPITIDDMHVSSLELYGKAAISSNWSAKTGYTYIWSDYSVNISGISVADVKNKSGNLWVKVEYKF